MRDRDGLIWGTGEAEVWCLANKRSKVGLFLIDKYGWNKLSFIYAYDVGQWPCNKWFLWYLLLNKKTVTVRVVVYSHYRWLTRRRGSFKMHPVVSELTSHLFLITGLRTCAGEGTHTFWHHKYTSLVNYCNHIPTGSSWTIQTQDALHPTSCIYLPMNALECMFAGKFHS